MVGYEQLARIPMAMIAKTRILLAVLLLLFVASPAVAQTLKPVYDTPVYDAEAKRYFELVNARAPAGTPYPRAEGLNWGEANKAARAQVYKGVRGQLAIVDTVGIHFFLLETFHPDVETWIGLRYWCSNHTLQWVDGTFLKPGSFAAWDRNWNQDIYSCKSAAMGNQPQYMPVAYSKMPNFTWIGKGWFKRYYLYFVEFPTGKP